MSSEMGGWLALGALIAFLGTLFERRMKRLLFMAGVVVVAWGFAPLLSTTVHIGSGTPAAAVAPEAGLPPVAIPPAPTAPEVVSEARRTGFWEGLGPVAKFFFVLFACIFLLAAVIEGSALSSGHTAERIIGTIIAVVVALVGALGMLASGGTWFFR